MLHKETVAGSTLGLLNTLMADDRLAAFVLVGGTALSLRIGHRVSVDLDLFSTATFPEQELSEYLAQTYGFKLDFIAKKTVKGEIEGIQIDCIAHEYPWVDSSVVEENIRLASLPDIAAMKLNAISGNGERIKDFIDVAYLSKYMSLAGMLEGYGKKYGANPIIPLKSITFFDDIQFDEPIRMMEGKYNWAKISRRLLEMQKHPDKQFAAYP